MVPVHDKLYFISMHSSMISVWTDLSGLSWEPPGWDPPHSRVSCLAARGSAHRWSMFSDPLVAAPPYSQHSGRHRYTRFCFILTNIWFRYIGIYSMREKSWPVYMSLLHRPWESQHSAVFFSVSVYFLGCCPPNFATLGQKLLIWDQIW